MQSLFSRRPGDMMNQLFYLPKQQFDNNHSEKNSPTKLIKLFKSTLSKQSPVKRSLEKLKIKPISSKRFALYNNCGLLTDEGDNNGDYKGDNMRQSKQMLPNVVEIISQRQRLVKGILHNNNNQRSSQSLKPQTKHSSPSSGSKQSQRCKTLQNIITKQPTQYLEHTLTTTSNNNNNKSQQLQSQLQLISIKKLKLPAKFRLTFSRGKQQHHKQHQHSLPSALPLLQKKVSLSPMAKKKINMSNLEIINKHKQFELQYRSSKQCLLPVPISITSVASGRCSNRRVSQFIEGRAIERIANSNRSKDTTKFNAKNQKIRLALESFLQQTYPTTEEFNIQAKQQATLRNQSEVKADNNHLAVKQQHPVKKQRKTLQMKKKSSQHSPNNHLNKQIRIQHKLPLDDYFKPWQHSQFVKQENANFESVNYFN